MSEISISLEGQDKVFASIWLSSTQVVVGTKESKLFLLELTHGRAFNIPLIDWDKDDDHGTPDTHSPFTADPNFGGVPGPSHTDDGGVFPLQIAAAVPGYPVSGDESQQNPAGGWSSTSGDHHGVCVAAVTALRGV
ncbi:hypothetical protein DFQ28_003118 [Apophysomyces sp. BC1034]|nr:hypothetical protein DFQ28_003118 [Apophysomyces sp. BC1034]